MVEVRYSLVVLVSNTTFKNVSATPASHSKFSRSGPFTYSGRGSVCTCHCNLLRIYQPSLHLIGSCQEGGPSHTVVEVSYSLVVLVGYTTFKNVSATPASCWKFSRSGALTYSGRGGVFTRSTGVKYHL